MIYPSMKFLEVGRSGTPAKRPAFGGAVPLFLSAVSLYKKIIDSVDIIRDSAPKTRYCVSDTGRMSRHSLAFHWTSAEEQSEQTLKYNLTCQSSSTSRSSS